MENGRFWHIHGLERCRCSTSQSLLSLETEKKQMWRPTQEVNFLIVLQCHSRPNHALSSCRILLFVLSLYPLKGTLKTPQHSTGTNLPRLTEAMAHYQQLANPWQPLGTRKYACTVWFVRTTERSPAGHHWHLKTLGPNLFMKWFKSARRPSYCPVMLSCSPTHCEPAVHTRIWVLSLCTTQMEHICGCQRYQHLMQLQTRSWKRCIAQHGAPRPVSGVWVPPQTSAKFNAEASVTESVN